MSKFFITRIIDVDKLNEKLDEFICTTGESNPYLFMNENTIKALPNVDNAPYNLGQIYAKANGVVGCYCGYKIFRDDTLYFGEVEIR